MDHEEQNVSQCHLWYFYDEDKDRFDMDTHLVMNAGGCPELSEYVCVYDSMKLRLFSCHFVDDVICCRSFVGCAISISNDRI